MDGLTDGLLDGSIHVRYLYIYCMYPVGFFSVDPWKYRIHNFYSLKSEKCSHRLGKNIKYQGVPPIFNLSKSFNFTIFYWVAVVMLTLKLQFLQLVISDNSADIIDIVKIKCIIHTKSLE